MKTPRLVSQVCMVVSVCVKGGHGGDSRCSSGEVHGPQGVVVNLNGFGQRLGVPTVTLPGHMAALSAVMFFVHQMVAGTEGHQVGVVGGRRDGDGAGAAHVGVAQLVCEQLELVSGETIVVPQNMVVGGPTGALYSSVTAEVKVKLVGMCDVRVHGGTSRNVSTTSDSLIAVGAEEARVVAFLHNNVCDARLVLLLQGDAGLTNSQQLIIQHLSELAF